MIKTFLISPPFGRWLSHPLCTSVMGSYTLYRRPGLLKQIIKTVRPHEDGWVNAVGLRNCGIGHVGTFDPQCLYSVAAIEPKDWSIMPYFIPEWVMVEMNLGCPNAGEEHFPELAIVDYVRNYKFVSIKLPPTLNGLGMGYKALDCGARYLHIANSIPMERGGFSAPSLMEKTVMMMVSHMVNHISHCGYDANVIAGGGIRTAKDIGRYRSVGATHFSLSTAWFHPLKTRKVIYEAASEFV